MISETAKPTNYVQPGSFLPFPVSFQHELFQMQSGRGNEMYTTLHQAPYESSREEAMLLFQRSRSQMDQQDKHGNTPLIHAVLQGRDDLVKLLVDNGAQVNVQNFQGETALLLSSEGNHVKSVKLLLDHGAKPNLYNLDGVSPLHIACAHGSIETLKLLVESGAQVNVQDDAGDSPLHFAAREGRYDIINFLLFHCGANPQIRNEDGENPSELAIAIKEPKVEQIFREFQVKSK